jgi:hypothetical protein
MFPDAGYYSNFMAVWKIPLRQHPHLVDDVVESNSAEMHQASSEEGIDSSKKNHQPYSAEDLSVDSGDSVIRQSAQQ